MNNGSTSQFLKFLLLASFFSACGSSPSKVANTPEEEAYVISKAEPVGDCRHVGGFFGYETSCGSPFGAVPDEVQFSCIRREITNARGNYAVIDAVIGAGWYKGRIFSCTDGGAPPPTPAPTSQTAPACIPGATQPCTGPGGCSGGQVCADDGQRFLKCDCGSQ